MKTRLTYLLVATLFLAAISPFGLKAQEYVPTPVVISKEKVRSNGKVFYSHEVLGRQTLYSISKAYGISMEEIIEANPKLKLDTEGLKVGQLILIPVKDIPAPAAEAVESAPQPQVKEAVQEESVKEIPKEPDESFFTHKVRWYEDLDGIAKKYGVSKESIKNINKMTSDKVTRKQILKIPRDPALWEGRTVQEEVPKQTIVPDEKQTYEFPGEKEEKAEEVKEAAEKTEE